MPRLLLEADGHSVDSRSVAPRGLWASIPPWSAYARISRTSEGLKLIERLPYQFSRTLGRDLLDAAVVTTPDGGARRLEVGWRFGQGLMAWEPLPPVEVL